MDIEEEDILGASCREALIIGILDTILAICLIITNGLVSWFYQYMPSVIVWIGIYTLHTFQIGIALCLVSATVSMDKNDITGVSRAITKCKVWRYFSRFALDWMFPMECFFLVLLIGGNGSQYLWICCGLVNALFRFVAEKSVLQYMNLLKLAYTLRPEDHNVTELATI